MAREQGANREANARDGRKVSDRVRSYEVWPVEERKET